MKQYKVWLRSVPGMYEQYDGAIIVFAENEDDAARAALLKLKQGAFPDRNNSMWKIENVELIYDN